MTLRFVLWTGAVWAGAGLVPEVIAAAPAPQEVPAPRSQARRMSVTWTEAPMNAVLRSFATFAGRSIVAGSNVTGFVTADINDQPWDIALRIILLTHGLVATENEYGIIRVDNIEDLNARESVEPVLTRSYRISFARASELQATIVGLLSARASVTIAESTNTLIVSDIARVQNAIGGLLR